MNEIPKEGYHSVDDLPESIRKSLREDVLPIYLDAFNVAWAKHADDPTHEREVEAHKLTWEAVRSGYH